LNGEVEAFVSKLNQAADIFSVLVWLRLFWPEHCMAFGKPRKGESAVPVVAAAESTLQI
jgi:hypothetical protein